MEFLRGVGLFHYRTWLPQVPWLGTSGVFARLSLYERSLELSMPMRSYRLEREEIVKICPLESLFSPGLIIQHGKKGLPSLLIFRTSEPTGEFLACLRKYGYPLSTEPTPMIPLGFRLLLVVFALLTVLALFLKEL
jgi:hypothetical protein